MEKILPNLELYVGGDRDYEAIKDRSDFSFLRCCKYGPGGHQQTLGYHTLAAPKGPNYLWVRKKHLMALNLLDLDDPNYISPEMIEKGLAFVKERLAAGDKVFVGCNAGHSRGPTTALLYLRTIGEMPYNFILSERVYRTLYPHYSPGQGMRQFARSNWGDLEGDKQ